MFTHLTRALLGSAVDLSPAEAARIHEAILHDHLVWNRAIDSLVEERAPGIIAAMHPRERAALEKKLNVVRNLKVTVKWEWIEPEKTLTGRAPQIRARRYFGDNPTHEEQLYFPLPKTVAQLAGYKDPWIGSSPSAGLLAVFENWLRSPDPDAAACLRDVALGEAEAAQKKQNAALPSDVLAAVSIQKALGK